MIQALAKPNNLKVFGTLCAHAINVINIINKYCKGDYLFKFFLNLVEDHPHILFSPTKVSLHYKKIVTDFVNFKPMVSLTFFNQVPTFLTWFNTFTKHLLHLDI
jgi:hypothetical protein